MRSEDVMQNIPSIIDPKNLLSGGLDGVTEFYGSINPSPVSKQLFVKRTSISRNSRQSLDFMQARCQLGVFVIGHFVPVGLRISSGFVGIWRVAIKQSRRAVIQRYDFKRRPVLDLHSQQSVSDFRKPQHAAKPARHHPAHAGTAGLLAVRPSAQRRRLSQSSADLAGTDKKAGTALKVAERRFGRLAREIKLFAGERS